MRATCVEAICTAAREDARIWLLTGDLGYSALDAFRADFPNRFVNCGVAEQNMMGVAAGLALEGVVPVVYSITPFVTLRCMEQIRNDALHHKLPVKIVGIGGRGLYASAGFSHSVPEVDALMRTLGLTVYRPQDVDEARALVRRMLSEPGPAFMEVGKAHAA